MFSTIITVMYLYIFVGTLKLFITSAIGVCFSNRTSMTYLFNVSKVEFYGARNNVCGFVKMLIRTFSIVIISFDSRTRKFLFNCVTCAEVGNPVLNNDEK